MISIISDRRAIEAATDPEAERIAAETAAEYLDVRLRLARVLLRIERSGTYHLSACSSVVQYAVRLGIPAPEARLLVDLGRVLESAVDTPVEEPAAEGDPQESRGAQASPGAHATVETLIRAGRLPVENAALVGRLLAKPECLRPGEDWVARAAALRTPELRREVQQRIEECAQGVPALVSVTVHITERTREQFHRARVLASREAATPLTEGQTFTRLVRFYLDARDERRAAPGTRRIGPTSAAPDERYVPAEVRRRVLARSGDRCEVPGCALDTFLEFAHVEPHADGGSREADNLLRLCHVHHVQFDADCLLLGTWREGRPVFRNARGEELSSGFRPGERIDDLTDAVITRRAFAAQVCERPPPVWATSV